MKKIGGIIVGVLTLFAITLSAPVVNALELDSSYISNLSSTQNEKTFTIEFDITKAIDFSTDSKLYINLLATDTNDLVNDASWITSVDFCKECSLNSKFIVDTTNGSSLSQAQVQGNHIKIDVDLSDNANASYYFENEDSKFGIRLTINDKDFNIEEFVFDISNNNLVSQEKSIDIPGIVAKRVNDLNQGKYNIYPAMGDETFMEFEVVPVTANEDSIHKMISVQLENRTIDEIVAEFLSKLGTSVYESEFNVNDEDVDMTINSNLINDIKALNEKVVYNAKTYDEDGNETILYSWTFDGSKITDTNFNLNLKVNLGTSKSKETIDTLVPDKDKSLVIEFLHHGALPSGTSVSVNVANKYKNGDLVTLYYYNEETKALEMVAKNIEVKDGFVELALEHCSEYVLAYQSEYIADAVSNEDAKTNNVETSGMNVFKFGGISLLSLIGIGYLLVSKRKMA